ncbi:MAG: 4-(cytidine 5'-diphospho)-2-C-methyl-D-erythritol kinase [Alphaproteobacteria bacterium]|nr:4-(cytidine 5'-diphospho)-2-C-methyl-D-erythritol kinase [Alphaproteobacteria bacterium]MDE1985370.1 4-(cytidine 5'-diphospho)-2-C-methyl-D-erythritol kinase [Alphaproteobacteria bacterium]MDE2162003.1 4-(cytidine 5'-diphospho)-2-C-methyl-D-erythritol kinase [Alphaproteobacteria bacterium]MDE2265423.1 4-(cytidine 5'-diphospho)-2-C-methyl-D-erythritol kinase [Alphaproteobacteria bacterium]MDE2499046.1 4-(cytidine 5'-diphospho)-2-C-methyl-D-erythritol kinase [Alphaproteobacteria bacterium]
MKTVPDAIREFAPAKINLFLHVGDKRADGYHALESLVVFAGIGDALTFVPSDDISLSIDGPFSSVLSSDPDNLVTKAARALAAQSGVVTGARITLTKNLPVASGIGGGSADAAAALRGLARLWDLTASQEQLRKLGETLGSDIPVCVDCATAWMEGRGEIVAPLSDIPAAPMVLVNPGVGVPTGKVFAALTERHGVGHGRPPTMASVGDLIAYLNTTANDLEAPARATAPAIGEVLDALAVQPGVLLTRMSGSGATCFALFESQAAAAAAAAVLRRARPSWWVADTEMISRTVRG